MLEEVISRQLSYARSKDLVVFQVDLLRSDLYQILQGPVYKKIQQRKRETAYKLRIGDILSGTPIVEDIQQETPSEGETISSPTTKEKFRFLELGTRDIKIVAFISA